VPTKTPQIPSQKLKLHGSYQFKQTNSPTEKQAQTTNTKTQTHTRKNEGN